jgi:pimeloyl-ACP methyl ester carboxylesterase
MVTADRPTDLNIEIPEVPPVADRPRTLDEAKAFLTRHLLTGRMPFPRAAHREVYDTIQALPGLDGASWAATWAAPADRHEALADASAARGDASAELQERLLSYQFNFYGRYPSPNHPAKLERYQRGVANFLTAAPLLDPPVEVIRLPFEQSEVVCYLRRPKGVTRPPVVFAWAGIDTWKEEMTLRVEHYLQAGLAVLTTDMPGTGQSPVLGSPDAERQYTPVFEWLRSRDDLAGDRVVIVGASFGGYWATKLAHTHREYLRGAVSWGGGAHHMYQRPWVEKSRYSDTYLMELPETRARMLGAPSFEEYAERIAKLSLLDQGILDRPCAPMLLVNGKQDSQCPIDDLYILLEHGDPKTARVFEGGHMAPGPRTVATIAKWVGERLA